MATTSPGSSINEQSDTASVDTTPFTGGIAARIAALKLAQVPKPGDNPIRRSVRTNIPNDSESVIRDHESSSSASESVYNGVQEEYNASVESSAPPPRVSSTQLSPDALAKALKRTPPPPPLPSRRTTTNNVVLPPVPPPPPPRRTPAARTRPVPNKGLPQDPIPDAPTPRRVPPPPSPRPQARHHTNSHTTPPPRPPVPISTRPRIPTPEQEDPQPVPEPHEDPESCLKCHSFSSVDAHAAQFPRESVSSLDQLAHDLTHPFLSSRTDTARAIFTWLHHNIAYDTHAFFNHAIIPSTPESTLQRGLAVCEGYAGLFADLAARVGLDVLVISGHGKGFGYVAINDEGTGEVVVPPFDSNHAWNAVVFDDDNWHLIDPCWGAGALDGAAYRQRFAQRWFTSTNEQFGASHFPSDPQYQMREDGTVLSWEEYILAPARPIEMQQFDELMYSADRLAPAGKYLEGGETYVFRVGKACQHLERPDRWAEDYALLVFASRDKGLREVMDRDQVEGGWVAHVQVPPGEGTVTIFIVNLWDGHDGKGLEADILRASMGRKAMSFQGIARWEVP